jgi:hypothetical protein
MLWFVYTSTFSRVHHSPVHFFEAICYAGDMSTKPLMANKFANNETCFIQRKMKKKIFCVLCMSDLNVMFAVSLSLRLFPSSELPKFNSKSGAHWNNKTKTTSTKDVQTLRDDFLGISRMDHEKWRWWPFPFGARTKLNICAFDYDKIFKFEKTSFFAVSLKPVFFWSPENYVKGSALIN